jgi:hypothetical protein
MIIYVHGVSVASFKDERCARGARFELHPAIGFRLTPCDENVVIPEDIFPEETYCQIEDVLQQLPGS